MNYAGGYVKCAREKRYLKNSRNRKGKGGEKRGKGKKAEDCRISEICQNKKKPVESLAFFSKRKDLTRWNIGKIQIVISTKSNLGQLTESEKCGIIFRQNSDMLMWLNGRAFHS